MRKTSIICDRCAKELKEKDSSELPICLTISGGKAIELCDECKLDFEDFMKVSRGIF